MVGSAVDCFDRDGHTTAAEVIAVLSAKRHLAKNVSRPCCRGMVCGVDVEEVLVWRSCDEFEPSSSERSSFVTSGTLEGLSSGRYEAHPFFPRMESTHAIKASLRARMSCAC
jgi:hypothetical protein